MMQTSIFESISHIHVHKIFEIQILLDSTDNIQIIFWII